MFNALKYIKGLEAAGVAREQAEAHAQLVIAAIEDEVATKSDLAEFKGGMAKDFAEFKTGTSEDFADFKVEIEAMKSEIIFKLGALIVACGTLGFAALGVLIALVATKIP